jgi:hypothetical protein
LCDINACIRNYYQKPGAHTSSKTRGISRKEAIFLAEIRLQGYLDLNDTANNNKKNVAFS